MNLRRRKSILKDIRRHGFFNACLLATIVLLSVMLLSGTVVSTSLRKGMKNMQQRLGVPGTAGHLPYRYHRHSVIYVQGE